MSEQESGYTPKQIHNHASAGVCRRDCPAYDALIGTKTVARFGGVRALNGRGEWVTAIPEPYFLSFGRVRCDCERKFRGRDRYRDHFAYAHVLGMDE